MLDLTKGPGSSDFGEPMLDAGIAATHVEHVAHVGCEQPTQHLLRQGIGHL